MGAGSSESRLLAALGYPLWIPALIVVLTDMKKDPYMRYHGWQALFWGLAWLAVWVVFSILTSVLWFIFLPLLFLLPLLWLAVLVVSIWFAVRAYNGERFEIPVVTNFARRYMTGEPQA
jgi:uncharacterized membrane protein